MFAHKTRDRLPGARQGAHRPRDGFTRLRRRTLVIIGAAMTLMQGTGCISASLASSTGPRSSGQWSVAKRQRVHVGERVQFDLVLRDPFRPFQEAPLSPTGIADYCVLTFADQRLETEPDLRGHFTFEHEFSSAQPGQVQSIKAEAFALRGRRDYMRIGDQWLRSESPYDEPDRPVADDSIKLVFYQATVDLTLGPVTDELMASTGRLTFRKHDQSALTIFADSPEAAGFVLSGPDPAGRYRVQYQPRGAELNATGTTAVVFEIQDRSGRVHRMESVVETP